MNPVHAAILLAAVAFASLVAALGIVGWLADRRAARAEARVVELEAALRAEQKTSAQLRSALHDLQAANQAWTRLLRPRHLDTTRPIPGGASCS